MDIQKLTREFRYNGVVLADPAPSFSLPQVRDFYANVYPEITSADIEGPEQVGGKQIYTFRRAVGTKGAGRAAERALQRLRAGGRLSPVDAPAHAVTAQQTNNPLGRQLRSILDQNRRATGPRGLAPSANHVVLP